MTTSIWESAYVDLVALAKQFPTFPLSVSVYKHEWVPEMAPEYVADYEDRLHAMTMHHIDLSLVSLTELVPSVFFVGNMVLCHPNNYAAVVAALHSSSPIPTDGQGTGIRD